MTTNYTDEKKKARNWWSYIRWVVYGAAGLFGAWLMFQSHQLYNEAFTIWGLQTTGDNCSTLGNFPWVGVYFQGICGTFAKVLISILALIVLLALTVLQSIPTFLYFVPDAIEGMVEQFRFNRKAVTPLTAQADDSDSTRFLINHHNKISESSYKTLVVFSIVAFVLEAFIVYTARGADANILLVLRDSLAFDLLLVGVLSFRSVFIARPKDVKTFGG